MCPLIEGTYQMLRLSVGNHKEIFHLTTLVGKIACDWCMF